MKKEVLLSVLVILFIFSAGVLAQEVTKEGLTQEEVDNFITEFVEDTNFIDEGKVENINEVDQSDLPEDIQVQDIDENNLGIYEVNFTDDLGEKKKVFVVTYATNEFKKKEVSITKNVQYLYFGISDEMDESSYLETSSGVKTGKQIGYVMLRSGSITGISTSLEVSGAGKLLVKVYKNGEDTGFHNLITTEGKSNIDFDLQSEDILNYQPGDIISVYVQQFGTVDWNNVVTSVETTN